MSDSKAPAGPPALPDREGSKGRPGNSSASPGYDAVADKIGLVPNIRKRDNLYQGICVAAFTLAGMVAAGWFWDGAQIRNLIGDDLKLRMLVGAGVGLVAGSLLSGFVLLVLGLRRRS